MPAPGVGLSQRCIPGDRKQASLGRRAHHCPVCGPQIQRDLAGGRGVAAHGVGAPGRNGPLLCRRASARNSVTGPQCQLGAQPAVRLAPTICPPSHALRPRNARALRSRRCGLILRSRLAQYSAKSRFTASAAGVALYRWDAIAQPPQRACPTVRGLMTRYSAEAGPAVLLGEEGRVHVRPDTVARLRRHLWPPTEGTGRPPCSRVRLPASSDLADRTGSST